MSSSHESPTVQFFRATPPGLRDRPPLASSLQSLETTFFLLALERYPSALISCVSAWESAIKARLEIPSEEGGLPLAKTLGMIREQLPELKRFDRAALDHLRMTRNQIVHYGFSPQDDQECARLLVETGFPFVSALYKECFAFHLRWHDVRPGLTEFSQLTAEEAASVGLLPDMADQLRIVETMYELNRTRSDFNVVFCFYAFSHYLRVGIARGMASSSQDVALEEAEARGIRYEAESAEKERVKKQIPGETWEFDCPMCNGIKSLVAGLDEESLGEGRVTLLWAICVSCHFVAPKSAYHLADLVIARDLEEQSSQIREAYL